MLFLSPFFGVHTWSEDHRLDGPDARHHRRRWPASGHRHRPTVGSGYAVAVWTGQNSNINKINKIRFISDKIIKE